MGKNSVDSFTLSWDLQYESQPEKFNKLFQALMSKYGVVVVEGVIETSQTKELKKSFWDYIENLTDNKIHRHDSTTWRESRKISSVNNKKTFPCNTRGRIDHYNIGWQYHAVGTRLAVEKVFKGIYPKDKLLSDFNSTYFNVKPIRCPYPNLDYWEDITWHEDAFFVPFSVNDHEGYTAHVALNDESEDGQVMAVIPKSHLKLKEIRNQREKTDRRIRDVYLDYPQRRYIRKTLELQSIRVPLKRGSMLIMDDRLVRAASGFCSTAADNSLHLQVLVSMMPLPKRETEVYKEFMARGVAYNTGLVSAAPAYPLFTYPQKPHGQGKGTPTLKEIPSVKLSPHAATLMGVFISDELKAKAEKQMEELEKTKIMPSKTKPCGDADFDSDLGEEEKKPKKKVSIVMDEADEVDGDSSEESDDEEGEEELRRLKKAKKKAKKAKRKAKKAARRKARQQSSSEDDDDEEEESESEGEPTPPKKKIRAIQTDSEEEQVRSQFLSKFDLLAKPPDHPIFDHQNEAEL